MTDDERMQRESSLIATIRRKLPEFAKACADDTKLDQIVLTLTWQQSYARRRTQRESPVNPEVRQLLARLPNTDFAD